MCVNFGWRIFCLCGVIDLKKNIIRLCFIIGILLSALCFLGINASAETVASGKCGGNVTWVLDDNGTLTISGAGKMYDYNSYEQRWGNHCNSIRKLVIENGVTSIGNYAFDGCTGLTSVTIPDSVTSIGGSAFADCTGLMSVTIPNDVTSIGDWAFRDCTNLTVVYWNAENIIYPSPSFDNPFYNPFQNLGVSGGFAVIFGDSVESIPNYAFSDCTELTNVTIPDSVTSIGDYAFSGCTGLTSVTIPDSVTSIERCAFFGCTGLTSVTISDGVTSIGYSTFSDCTCLTSVTIPDSITSIERCAFSGCTGLISVTIPGSVTNLGAEVFSGCTGLTSVTISDGVTDIGFSTFSGCTSLTSVTIPDSVTGIGGYTFSGCTGLTSVTMPDSVTSIGPYTFSGCTGLTSVTIPNSVKSIGVHAFSGCMGLTSVTILDGVVGIREGAFRDCTALTSVTIPESIIGIESGAFSGCTKLTEISVDATNTWYFSLEGVLFARTEIISYPAGKAQSHYIVPDIVTSIDDEAFFGCTGLTSVTIPDSVTSIGSSAFYGCTGLTSVTIPDSVTSIGSSAFYGCTGLTSVTIPDGVTSIGDYAFYGCKGLTSVTIPDSVTTISNRAFYGCTGLTSVTIPDSVTSIGEYAFRNCESLTTVNWNAVNVISYPSFYSNPFRNAGTNSDGLAVVFGNGVEIIPERAFYECTDLTSVTMSNGVTSIGNYAFSYCTGLMSVAIPDSVTSIGSSAFSGCAGLESIYFLGTSQQWESIEIGSYNSSLTDATIYCLDGEHQLEFEISNNVLTSYTGDEVDLIIPDVVYGVMIKGIAKDAFNACSQIESITIPDTVTNISSYAFDGLINLKSITVDEGNESYSSADGVLFNKDQTVLVSFPSAKRGDYIIPETVTEIDYHAFNNTEGLTRVTIPESVVTIKDSAFVNCSNLKNIYWNAANVQDNHPIIDYNYANVYFENVGSLCGGCEVVFGDTVESIPQYAFYNCDGLKKVAISANVRVIGYRAFQYCNDLESIDVSVDNATYASHNGVLYNKDLTKLIQCPSGKSGDYIIPEGTIIIEENGFAGCDKLDSITLPQNIKVIARWAFYDCKDNVIVNWNSEALGNDELHLNYGYAKTTDWFNKPVKIVFGSNLKTINAYTFNGCKTISKVVLPSNIEKIDTYAFYNCSSLFSIKMSGNIKQIEYAAFKGCEMLSDIYYDDSLEQWNKIIIEPDEIWMDIYGVEHRTPSRLLSANLHYNPSAELATSLTLLMSEVSVNNLNKEATLMLASYNKNSLVDVKSVSVSNDTTVLISETGINTNGVDLIKAFLWEDIQSMKPICAAQSISIE